jgi:haloalkane dehalogenase
MNFDWIDRSAYPFASHRMAVDGGQMHYVDEGAGRPVVMVHGTPTWSFLYRHLISGLSPDFRVVAPDHIGFGLSDKPPAWGYRPADHARNLETLIEGLGLEDITLVLHDLGGPIGMGYALQHPEKVRSLVIFNTFFWSLKGDPAFETPSRLFSNPLGKFLYKNMNFSPVVMVRAAWGNRSKLTPAVHRHYTQALPSPAERQGTWQFVQELQGSSDWYADLWERRERVREKPALLLWGMKDIAFKEKELQRAASVFADARIQRFPEAGHFIQDEAGPELVPIIRAFLDQT